MLDLKVHFFGPADGSIAISSPGATPSRDDSLFLASSDFSLAESASVLRVQKRPSGDRQLLRVAAYRQVYELGMGRLGHAFGVAMDFEYAIPSGALVLATLDQIMDLLGAHCVRSIQFCEYARFQEFVVNEMEPSFAGILNQLSTGPVSAIERGLAPRRAKFHMIVGSENSAAASSLLDWFAADPVATLCDTLLISSPGSGELGSGYRTVADLQELQPEAIDALFRASLRSEEEVRTAKAEIVGLRAIRAQYSVERAELEKALSVAESRNEVLQQKFNAQKLEITQLRGDIASARSHVARPTSISPSPPHAGRPLTGDWHAPQRQRNPSPVSSDDSDDLDVWRYVVLILSVVIALALIAIVYFWIK